MFCGNCGTELKDNAKFCGDCGQPVGRSDENNSAPVKPETNNVAQAAAAQTPVATSQPDAQVQNNTKSPSADAQIPVATPLSNIQIQNNNQPVSADAQAPVVITQPDKKPKKKKTGLIVACIVISVLVIIGIVVAVVFATNTSQTTNNSEPTSTKALTATVDNSSNIDAKFDVIIKENEQLKAWWDCDLDLMGSNIGTHDDDYISNLTYSNMRLQALTNFYPDINVTTASPSKYAKIDMNGDGQEELVVMGKNAYSTEAIIAIYYYDKSDKQIKMLKVSDCDFMGPDDSYTDIVCGDRSIKSRHVSKSKDTLTIYKMESDSINKIADCSIRAINSKLKSDVEKNQTDEYKSMNNGHVEDTSIEWSNFDSVDPVYSFVGTVKFQTSYERMTDPNSRSEYMDTERNDESINSPYYDKETKLIVFERDEGEETPCFNGDGRGITTRNAIAYGLAKSGKDDPDIETTDAYQKLSEYKDKKVMITINMNKMLAPTGVTGWGVDLLGNGSNVVSVSPV